MTRAEPRLSHRSRTVLLVAPNPALATVLSVLLRNNGYAVEVVGTYLAAKIRLETHLASLVTEIELGAYNGLQLALHARAEHVGPVVIGPTDVVLEREAAQLGIAYIRKDALSGEELLAAMDKASAASMIEEHAALWATSAPRGAMRRASIH